MTGFDLHHIEHLSASSLNTAAAQLSVWVLERLLDKRAPVGAAAHRGSAIKAAWSWGCFTRRSLLSNAVPLRSKNTMG